MDSKLQTLIQVLFLFLIQCSSIAGIILNALVLNLAKHVNQSVIVGSPQEFTVIIMGVISLSFSTILLCFYIKKYNKSAMSAPSKRLLSFGAGLSLFIVALWMTLNIITLTHFNESSTCRTNTLNKIIFIEESSEKPSLRVCSLVDAMITVGFLTIGMWLMLLLFSIYIISDIRSFSVSELFTLQAPIHPCEEKCIIVSEKTVDDYYRQTSTPQNDPMTKSGTLIKEYAPSITSSTSTLTNNYVHKPTEMKTKESDLFIDFQFENIQLDLMLPSTSELIGTKRKNNKSSHHHVY